MNVDAKFMRAAIEVANLGRGKTRPNPAVGAVIVHDAKIISTGFTQPAGGNHAEIEALNGLPEDIKRSECSIYITLEPCCVFGRTPPCTDALISSGIKEVIVGVLDPNPNVQGEGVRLLKEAGIDVHVGCLEGECLRSNAPYFSVRTKKRPWFIAKYAMTLDGKIATLSGDSKWITNEAARQHVGQLRDRYDAILVGTQTLINDNPRLTARIEGGIDPVRILIDRTQRASLDSVALDGAAQTLLFAESFEGDRHKCLEERGIKCIVAPFPNERLDLGTLCEVLAENNIMSVLVEGGGKMLGSFLDCGLIDEVWAYIAPTILGGPGQEPFSGVERKEMRESIALTHVSTLHFGDNIVINGFVEV